MLEIIVRTWKTYNIARSDGTFRAGSTTLRLADRVEARYVEELHENGRPVLTLNEESRDIERPRSTSTSGGASV